MPVVVKRREGRGTSLARGGGDNSDWGGAMEAFQWLLVNRR